MSKEVHEMDRKENFEQCKTRCEDYLNNGLYDEAVICGHELLDLYESENLSHALEYLFEGHERIFYNFQKPIFYMTYMNRLIDIYEKQGDISRLIRAMYVIGDAYIKGNDLGRAEEVFKKVMKLAKNNKFYHSQADALNGLGNIQDHMGNHEKALPYYEEAFELSKTVGYEWGKRFAHNIGYTYKLLGDFDKAVEFLKISRDYVKSIEAYDYCANSTNELGDAYRRKGDYVFAEKYLKEGLELCELTKHNQFKKENYLFQTELYIAMEEYKKALSTYKKYNELESVINSGKYQRALEELEHKIALKNKEDENQTIRMQNIELDAYSKELDRSNKALKKALEETRRMHREVIRSEKDAAYNRMIVGIAHKVNTFFGSILMATTHIEELVEQAKQKYSQGILTKKEIEEFFEMSRESVDMIFKSYNKVDKFIRNLNKVTINLEEMGAESSLGRLIDQCLGKYENEIRSLQCKVVKDIDKRIPNLKGAEILMKILDQLFENTIKYAFKGCDNCRIDIKASLKNEVVAITFTDNGVGINEEVVQNIFDPFFTSDMGLSGGTGLGLYITYKTITEVLEGTITCNSRLGEGTEFVIEIPISWVTFVE